MPQAKPQSQQFNAGQLVRFIDPKHGFWRNGTFERTQHSRKHGMLALIQHPTLGRFKIRISDVAQMN